MGKLSSTAMATLSFLFIAGCDNAQKTPPGKTASTVPPAPVAGAPLLPIPGSIDLPKFSEWIPTQGVKIRVDGEAVVVDGDNSRFGYQISSLPIEVKPGADLIVRVDHAVESGTVCPGILTGDSAAWLVPASTPTIDIRFNSGSNKGIVVVMANCNQPPLEIAKSKFRLKSAVIAPTAK